MKLITLSVTWGFILLLVLSNVAIQQPNRSTINNCIKPLALGNRVLSDSLQQYLKYIDNYEMPIIAVKTLGDTTHYFISAFIGTYMIKQNPPSAIETINNREALLYFGKESIVQIAPACYNYVMKKYSRLLHVDKINRQNGRPPSYKYEGFIYDPIKIDIFITKQGQIGAKHARKIPFIKYD